MSNPCDGKVKSTGASKMAKISGSAKNYEHTGHKAERFCNGGYAAGGPVQQTPPVKDQSRYGDGSGGNELGYGAVRKADGGAAGDGASFDERYPKAVWGGGKGPSIDAAFSGDDPSKTEFPLGRALREKAKKMKGDL